MTISKHNDLLRTNKQSAQNLPYSKSHSEVHPRYPYVVGPKYKYNPILSNTTADARLENLPEGVIRIRDRENKLPQFGAAVHPSCPHHRSIASHQLSNLAHGRPQLSVCPGGDLLVRV